MSSTGQGQVITLEGASSSAPSGSRKRPPPEGMSTTESASASASASDSHSAKRSRKPAGSGKKLDSLLERCTKDRQRRTNSAGKEMNDYSANCIFCGHRFNYVSLPTVQKHLAHQPPPGAGTAGSATNCSYVPDEIRQEVIASMVKTIPTVSAETSTSALPVARQQSVRTKTSSGSSHTTHKPPLSQQQKSVVKSQPLSSQQKLMM